MLGRRSLLKLIGLAPLAVVAGPAEAGPRLIVGRLRSHSMAMSEGQAIAFGRMSNERGDRLAYFETLPAFAGFMDGDGI